MSNTITAISVNVGAGASVDFQPAAGQAWEINIVSSNNVFVGNVPDVQVLMKKGVATAIMLRDPTVDPGNRGRMHKWLVTNTVFLSVTNTGGAGAEIGIIGKKTNPFNVLSDVLPIGAGATIHVDPGSNNDMMVYEMGNSVFTAGPADINPNVLVVYDNLTLATAVIWDPANIFGHDKQQMIPVSHALQLNVTDSGGAGCNFAFSAEKLSLGKVKFTYQTVAPGADMDVIPPAGEEWLMSVIASSILAGGGAPNDYPDVNAMILIGANESHILEAGSVATSLLWNALFSIAIDNANRLRAHNANVGGQDVCIAGILSREY